jgi:hypothetical protein
MGVKLVSSSNGSVELVAPVTASNYTATFPANTGTVITTASTFAGTGPAFSAYASAGTQSISNGTSTKVQINTVEFDTASAFDTTNYRFKPLVAGYYQINGAVSMAAGANTQAAVAVLVKNGTSLKNGNFVPFYSTIQNQSTVNSVVYLNGSTDYIELYIYQNTGSTWNVIGANSTVSYFNGAMIRSA